MSRGESFVRRFSLASLVVVAALIATNASPAGAAVTIGQLAPDSPPPALCLAPPFDDITASVSSGNSYVMPAAGTVTSWSHRAAVGVGQQLTMKVFRNVGGPNWMVVGHDGPRTMSSAVTNTFPVSIAVTAGDVLGLHSVNAPSVPNACEFNSAGNALFQRFGNLVDGASDAFPGPFSGARSNVTAVLETTPCKGKAPTVAGTAGANTLTGTPGADVMVGLGGKDSITGLGGNDVICGGPGKDMLKGGPGKDTLLGQKGKDTLKGGGGKDTCTGGKGNDTASACEVEKSI